MHHVMQDNVTLPSPLPSRRSPYGAPGPAWVVGAVEAPENLLPGGCQSLLLAPAGQTLTSCGSGARAG